MAGPSWEDALASAKKSLGKDAKIPDKKMATVFKNIQDANKQLTVFETARDALEKSILNYQNTFSKVRNSLGQASDDITDDNYGLDPKKDDDKKKIDEAQKTFKAYFDGKESEVDGYIKDLDELEKHLAHVTKYKCQQVS